MGVNPTRVLGNIEDGAGVVTIVEEGEGTTIGVGGGVDLLQTITRCVAKNSAIYRLDEM